MKLFLFLNIQDFILAPCDEITCQNDGNCLVNRGNASCACTSMFRGARCELCKFGVNIGIVGIGHISSHVHCYFVSSLIIHFLAICEGVCKNGGTCEIVNNATTCNCASGYYGRTCSECMNIM